MGFRRSDLQPAFSVPGDHHFTVWGYGTTDTLDEVLRPRYVQGGRAMLTLGDLIYVTTRPRRGRPDEPERGEVRAALVMVGAWERGDATLRLVQDFGRPDDPGAQLRPGPAASSGQAGRAAAPARDEPPAPPPSAKQDPPAPAGKRPAPRKAPATKEPATRKTSPASSEPPQAARRSPAPSLEPPRRKRGRPPKNRATMGG